MLPNEAEFKVVLTDKGLELKKKTREELLEQYKGWNYEGWSNLAKVTYKRTYARPKDEGGLENWPDTCARVIDGNTSLVDPKFIKEGEQEQIMKYMMSRKMTPAGRGLWMSGSKAADKFAGSALNNCWVTTSDHWENYVMAQDLLMLGGGVGMTVEHRFTCRLPEVKSKVKISHLATKDADFIVPDTREGWCELTRKVLKSYFVTGKSFTYSTVCIRGAGELINGFGGKASGPLPLISFVENLCAILKAREDKHMRPIDAADVLCAIAHMVVAGNVRRSALMILGDPWDKEFLTIKRWDLIQVPAYRYRANFSVVASDFEDLHPLFWASYNEGEPIGIFNRKNAQLYGRMGEPKKDKCVGVNPCKPLYSTILTKDGYITFEQALKKDSLTVMGIDGKWKEASKPFKTGENRVILKIQLSSGYNLYGTDNHLHMKSDGSWTRLDELKLGDSLKGLESDFTIVDIEPEYDVQDVYDITVYDDTHAFYDVGVVTHNCAEATLEDGEPCNLVEIFLSNLDSVEEFVEAAKLATRMAIRTTCTFYSHKKSAEVIARNRRIGVGITGLLNSPLFTEENLDLAYKAIDEEAEAYCAEMGIPKCIKTTVIKPSGTVSKVGDCLDGCHPAYSKYIIQRIRFSSSDDLVPLLRAAGHNVEMETFQDGKKNPDTVVVDFYVDSKDAPAADGGFDTWKQLDVLLKLQKHWADQAVSITVYYTKENLEQVKVWLKENISKIKSISFLLHQGHGFIQAPKEPITEEQYLVLSKDIRELDISTASEAKEMDNADCEGGFCPIK